MAYSHRRHWLPKRKVVNDKGNLRWRFPVNSEVGRTASGCKP